MEICYICKSDGKKKIRINVKNLHVSYLQMENEVFGDEESTNASVVKEFERFGTDVGMWGNEDPNIPTESGYVKSVNKKYVFETLENEGKLFDELELKKNVVVKGESKVYGSDIKSEENGSESSRRRKRETKDKITKEEVQENNEENKNVSGRRIRSYNRKKEEEKKEQSNEEKRGTHKIYRRGEN